MELGQFCFPQSATATPSQFLARDLRQPSPSTSPSSHISQSWPSSWFSVAPSRATLAGLHPSLPLSRSAFRILEAARGCMDVRQDMNTNSGQPQHAPVRLARQDSDHLEPHPRRDLVRLPQEEPPRPLPHCLRLRTYPRAASYKRTGSSNWQLEARSS